MRPVDHDLSEMYYFVAPGEIARSPLTHRHWLWEHIESWTRPAFVHRLGIERVLEWVVSWVRGIGL